MDNPRLYLWIGLALLVWMNVVQWDRDFGQPATSPTASTTAPATQGATGTTAPGRSAQEPGQPAAELARDRGRDAGTTRLQPACQRPRPRRRRPRSPTCTSSPTCSISIMSLQGGDLVRADLLKYPRDKKPGSPAVSLLIHGRSEIQRDSQRFARRGRRCRTRRISRHSPLRARSIGSSQVRRNCACR